jgi:integrase
MKATKTITKRGTHYHVDMVSGDSRLRGGLGTTDPKVAKRLANRLEFAMSDGPSSKVWDELRPVLPAATFSRFSRHAGAARLSTWDELLSIFWTSKKVASSTRARYDSALDSFSDLLADRRITRLADITPETITSFHSARKDASTMTKQYRNGAGANLDMGVLAQVFKLAVDRGLLPVSPVHYERTESVRRVTQPFTTDELSKLRGSVGDDLLVFLLLRWTGLRGSDAVALRWDHIDWKTGEIRMRTQKTQKEVIIPLHGELLGALSIATNEGTVLGIADRPALYRRLAELGKRAGVVDCRPHRFRDTLAVDLLLKGCTLHEVAQVLGNTAGVVEQYYAPFVPALRQKIRAVLNNEIGLEA